MVMSALEQHIVFVATSRDISDQIEDLVPRQLFVQAFEKADAGLVVGSIDETLPKLEAIEVGRLRDVLQPR